MTSPHQSIYEGVQFQRRKLLRRLLLGLLLLLAFATALSVLVSGRDALTLRGLTLNIVIAACIVAGLWLLNRKHVTAVVWLVVGGLLLAAVNALRFGITGNAAAMMVFLAPVTLVGLVLGRRALLFVAAISYALVLTVFFLERAQSPLLSTPPQDIALAAVIIFTLVLGLLVLFLDRFALTLGDALQRSEEREAALREEMAERVQLETRLQLATEAAQVGLWSWDLERNEIEWSPQMRQLFGVDQDAQITLETFFERVHPEDRDGLRKAMSDSDALGDPYRVVLPSGEVRWMVGRGRTTTPVTGGSYMLGAAFDVTAIKEAEVERSALHRKEREAREMAERAGDRLTFLADAGRLLADSLDYRQTLARVANLVVPRLADWCAIDVLAEGGELERVVVLHSDPQKVRFAHELQRRFPSDPGSDAGAYRIIRTGEPQLYAQIDDEVLRGVAQGEEHLEMLRQVGFQSAITAPLISRGRPLGVITLVHAESGRQYDDEDLRLVMQLAERAALAVDNARLYSESQQLNVELEERVAARTVELQAANEELESFTYSASHDLRAPLRGINGFSKALLDDYGDKLDDTAREYLRRISAGAVRMGELIDDLLELSRIANAELQHGTIDISELARGIAGELQEQHGQRRVAIEIEEGLRAHGDERLFRIALENMMGNAWKFTAHLESAHIAVGKDAELSAFFVRDNGAGFDMSYADKLFIPFQRLHRPEEYEGTGIGLATTKRIVERLNGRVWAQSAVGEGATFYFTLPQERPVAKS